MNAKFLLLCSMILAGSSAWADPPVGGQRPRSEVTVDPNDPRLYPKVTDPNYPEKSRPTISLGGREKLGLTSHSWSGVVDPQVYARLDALNELVSLLKTTKTTKAIQTLFSMRMIGTGTIYVQVQLKHEPKGKPDSKENLAAIKDTQRRVLRSLTAAEFHVRQLFESSAGFVGYASKEALDKLAMNPDVAGVCLDDKPFPWGRQIIFKNFLPPAKPGEAADEPGVAEGKVEAEVYRAFALTDRVDVIAALRTDSLPPSTDVPSEMRARHELRDEAERRLQDRVLSTLTADEFWLEGRGYGFNGRVTREGLQKLWKHPDVVGIGLETIEELQKLP